MLTSFQKACTSFPKSLLLRSFSSVPVTCSAYAPETSSGTFTLSRRFEPKEKYTPKDLNEENYNRFRDMKRKLPKKDIFEVTGIDPMKKYKDYSFLSNYVTKMGKIIPRSQTGLTPDNQKKVAKAIRRSRALGFIPCCYKDNQVC
ncbi:hypothetical protein DSO57_1023532 [Entomophthora muscae]|uniref:Uncharacterized protein n=2 Tax=Entomophthora muscae TaxID=34485 RepID=A0ACC2UNR2_9FUNG|nr:hypothetical protein DSO57_1027754 [Entomophthora muscae]KAJ9088409.1 hypothetical protein DSO57_1023532 [Entomophthora muscae]